MIRSTCSTFGLREDRLQLSRGPATRPPRHSEVRLQDSLMTTLARQSAPYPRRLVGLRYTHFIWGK